MNFLKLTNFLQCKLSISFLVNYLNCIEVCQESLESERHAFLETNRGIDHLQPARSIPNSQHLGLWALVAYATNTSIANNLALWPFRGIILPQELKQ